MTYTTLVRACAAAAIGAVLSSGVTAQQNNQDTAAEQMTPRVSKAFRVIDTDDDGRITLSEIKSEQMRLLTAADIDGDGKLSVTEFRRRGMLIRSLRVTSLFDLLDTDGDQMVSAEELAAPSERWLKRYDVDGDGLTAGELPGKRGWRKNRHGRQHRHH